MPEISLATLDALIPSLYEAATQALLWPAVLASLCDALNASSGELVNAGILLSQGWVVHNMPSDPIEVYIAEFAATDSVMPLLFSQALVKPVAFRFADIPGLLHGRIYDDVVKPFGMRSMCIAMLGQDAGQGPELFCVARSMRRPFQQRDVDAINLLKPHLRSAGIVQMRLEAAGEPFRSVLQGMAAPVVMLDALGKVQFSNLAAEVLLRAQDGVRTQAGRLMAMLPADTAVLQAAIDRAIASQLASLQTPGEDLVLSRPSGKAPLAVHVAPLGRDNPYWAGGRRAAVGVFIEDPDREALSSADRLRAVYGLTPAEARVALALAEGLDPVAMAERFGTASKTVRTQLEAVLAKLGVRRQAQAVRRVLAVARSYDPGPNTMIDPL